MPAEQKRTPRYSGVLQTRERDITKRKRLGRIVLYDSESASKNAPKLVGMVYTNYGKALVALWENRRESKEQRVI